MRHPCPNKARRPRARGLTSWILFLALTPCPQLAAGEPEAPQTVIDRIQRECLRAYPPEMLAEMASGSEDIPAPVDDDPEAQMQFLDKEIPRDKGLFYPSLLDELTPAFEAYLGPDVDFLDLGSGDGRVVFLAAVLGARATGIEYDEELVEVSERALAALEDVVDGDRVEIVQGDFFEVSWSDYDVIFYFDLSSFLQERVREKLRAELAPDAALLVGHEQAPFPGLELTGKYPDSRHPIVKVYRQPEG
jgi:SAM-dependent methyltransferase